LDVKTNKVIDLKLAKYKKELEKYGPDDRSNAYLSGAIDALTEVMTEAA
jgi:hypothetical protein